ncbi:MAG: PAS domain S-box protein [Verrucomicrobia bacterium]|nr:PAS domain S-box protein [Verrucomicrobiota bacterium]
MSTSIHADGQWTERCTGQPDPSALEPQAFRRFFERSVDPIWILDPHTSRVLECNQAAVELLGADTKAALLGLRPADVSPPVQPDGSRSTDRAAILTALARAQGGARFEWELQRLDGRTVPVEVVSTRIPVGDGDVFFVVSRDIRQRRETETALAEQEQLLASVADHVREAIYRSGPDHELMFVNRAYRQLFGYPSLEALRQIPREQLYADPTRRAALLRRLTEEGGFENEEVEFRRRDGSTFWGLANAVVIRDPRSGRPLYHVGSITDITERKQAADAVRALNATLEERVAERTAALQASEARFRTLVEHAPEAIVVFDGETGRFLDANEKALRLYGITRERLLACGPADVSPGRQPDGRTSTAAARDWIDRALAGEAPCLRVGASPPQRRARPLRGATGSPSRRRPQPRAGQHHRQHGTSPP